MKGQGRREIKGYERKGGGERGGGRVPPVRLDQLSGVTQAATQLYIAKTHRTIAARGRKSGVLAT